MRITFTLLFLSIIYSIPTCAQSWPDVLVADLESRKMKLVVTNYFEDEKLLNEINSYRQQINQSDQLSFDSTGLYQQTINAIDPNSIFASVYAEVLPMQHKSTTTSFYKQLTFEDKGEINTEIRYINKQFFDQLLKENRIKTINTWISNPQAKDVIAMEGISAVTAMKLFLHIEKDGDYVLVKWKYINRFVIQSIPSHIANKNTYQQLTQPK